MKLRLLVISALVAVVVAGVALAATEWLPDGDVHDVAGSHDGTLMNGGGTVADDARADKAGLSRTPRDPSKGAEKSWSGTIAYTATGGYRIGSDTYTLDVSLVVTIDGASVKAVGRYLERFHRDTSCGPRLGVTEGTYDGPGRWHTNLGDPPRLGSPYMISGGTKDFMHITHSNTGGCAEPYSFPGRQDFFTASGPGTVKPGPRLQGEAVSEPVYTCVSGMEDCTIRETLTWNVARGVKRLAITELELFDRDPFWNKGRVKGKQFTKLEYLSASPHPYFKHRGGGRDDGEGQTRIYGTIEIQGPAGDEFEKVELEVLENGTHVATAKLAPWVVFSHDSFQHDDIEAFDQTIAVNKPDFLFRLPASEAAKINQTEDGKLMLRVRVRSSSGEEATRDFGFVTKLVLYEGSNRYGGRDDAYGGDGWAQPSTIAAIRHFSATNQDLLVGDISNMNGGRFWPHSSHGDGRNVDAWVEGYSNFDCFDANAELKLPEEEVCLHELTELAATKLVALFNDATYGPRIEKIGVTYRTEWATRRQFFDAIEGITLADGRKATDVMLPWQEHDTHFHLRFKE